jgi:acyl-CoA thioesterase I
MGVGGLWDMAFSRRLSMRRGAAPHFVRLNCRAKHRTSEAMIFPRQGALETLGIAAFFIAAMVVTAPSSARAAPVKLLAFGDSLIHGYGLDAGATFPEQLESALQARGFDVRVINAGNSGDTTAGGRSRLDWALADKPDAVLVELGANDGLRGLDPAQTYDNLDAILARLSAKKLPVLLAGMLAPRNLGAEYTQEFDSVFPRLAKKHGVLLYPFFLDGVALDPSLNQADGIHPNPAGVKVLVERIAPRIIELIALVRHDD